MTNKPEGSRGARIEMSTGPQIWEGFLLPSTTGADRNQGEREFRPSTYAHGYADQLGELLRLRMYSMTCHVSQRAVGKGFYGERA
jgi:hypothetical protein